MSAICWATAIILLAAADRADLIDHGSARVLFIVLPLIAWQSIAGSSDCRTRTRKVAG
jgi:hypothetical protein